MLLAIEYQNELKERFGEKHTSLQEHKNHSDAERQGKHLHAPRGNEKED